MIKDQKNDLKVVQTIIPQTSDDDIDGAEVDVLGFEACTLEVVCGAGTVGTVKIQESDTSGSGFADVAADEIIGTQDVAVVASDVVTIGYVGIKRYVRAVFTEGTSGPIAAVFALGCPHVAKTGANS